MGNFLEIWLNSQMDFPFFIRSLKLKCRDVAFSCLGVLRDVLIIDRVPLITRQNLTTHISKSFFLWWLLVAFFFVKAEEVKNCACICYCCYDSCLCPILTIIFWIALNWDCNINGYVQRKRENLSMPSPSLSQKMFLLSYTIFNQDTVGWNIPLLTLFWCVA